MASTNTQSNNSSVGAEKLSDKGGEVKDSIAELIEIARDAAQDKVSELMQEGALSGEKIEEKVRQQPIKSLAVASGLGLLAGIYLSKK